MIRALQPYQHCDKGAIQLQADVLRSAREAGLTRVQDRMLHRTGKRKIAVVSPVGDERVVSEKSKILYGYQFIAKATRSEVKQLEIDGATLKARFQRLSKTILVAANITEEPFADAVPTYGNILDESILRCAGELGANSQVRLYEFMRQNPAEARLEVGLFAANNGISRAQHEHFSGLIGQIISEGTISI